MKVKIDFEHLEKLEIVDKLRRMRGQLDCTKPYDIDQLAARLTCSPALLVEVLESMGISIEGE